MDIRIQPLGLSSNLGKAVATKTQASDAGFGQLLSGLLDQTISQQMIADDLSKQLAWGEIDDVAAVMIASEKASLSWQLLQQVRNKLLEAFQEIMRMQV